MPPHGGRFCEDNRSWTFRVQSSGVRDPSCGCGLKLESEDKSSPAKFETIGEQYR